ncbi:MAG TPA: hypothetical protein VFV99_03690 [Kofleriaceae bacterium]|nr:hypothetical protein [Kofleriaceae bacterium]
MGALSQARFEELVNAGCTCGGRLLEIRSYIDRSLVVMAAEPNNEGRWAHDGEKFADGTYRITCATCAKVVFESDICPRCNAAGGLARALGETSRLTLPKRCPQCNELELMALAFVPASARYGGEAPKPKQLVDFGDPGYHVVAYGCNSCDRAVVAEKCPLCDAHGPLRPRP